LGNDVAKGLLSKHPDLHDSYISEIGAIVSAACMAHRSWKSSFRDTLEKRPFQHISPKGNGIKLKEKLNQMNGKTLFHFEGNGKCFPTSELIKFEGSEKVALR